LRCVVSKKLSSACKILSIEESDTPIHMFAFNDGVQGSLRLEASDGIKHLALFLTAEVDEDFDFIVPARYIPVLSNMNGDIIFSALKKHMRISDSSSTINIPFFEGNGPLRPAIGTPLGTVTTELNIVKDLFERALFAAGSEKNADHRFNYGCILLECNQDVVRAVGSDRRVIAISTIYKGSPYQGRFLLPKVGVRMIGKMDGDMLTMSFYDRAVGFTVDGEMSCELYIPEHNGVFPPYEDVTVKGRTFLKGSRDEFLSVVSHMRKLSDKLQINMSYANYVKRPPRFSARDDFGVSMERFPDLRWEGDPLKIKVNASTFYGVIKHARGNVTVSFTNDMGPIRVEGEDSSYVAFLMPFLPTERR